MKFQLVVLAYLLGTVLATKDYCRPALCNKDRQHIGCNNSGDFDPSCSRNAAVEPISIRVRRQILFTHNKLRDNIASGEEPGFKPAARMARMHWNEELENLAKLNVQRCRLELDQCRNTDDFPFVGQNLGLYAFDPSLNYTAEQVILKHFAKWAKERKNIDMELINNLTINSSKNTSKKFAHFTQMIQARSNYIGCAFLRQTKDQMTQTLMACNYSFANVFNKPVYETSDRPASRCQHPDEKFKNLCSIQEKYD